MWNTSIGWAEALAYKVMILNSITPFEGGKEEAHAVSWSIFRWIQAAHALTFVDYAGTYQQVAPTKEHLVTRGLLTKEELALILSTGRRGPYDIPLIWAFNLLNDIELKYGKDPKTGATFVFSLTEVRNEIQKQRVCDATLRGVDYIPMPLPYMQILAFAVYAYFAIALFGRQFVAAEDQADDVVQKYAMAGANDYYVPVLTAVELIFYTGWLKTMALLFDPLSKDGFGYNLPEIEEGVMGRAITIFQATFEGALAPMDTSMHGYEPSFDLKSESRDNYKPPRAQDERPKELLTTV